MLAAILTGLLSLLPYLISFFVGVGASLFIWVFTTKIFVPKITICSEIEKRVSDNKHSEYRLKIINEAQKRDAYNVSTYFRIHFEEIYFTLELPYLPILKRNDERTIPINIKGLNSPKIDGLSNATIKVKYHTGELTLEDFFNEGQKVSLEIVLFAYDKFSGAQACVLSHKILKENIVRGKFDKGKREVTPEKIEENPGEL
jgi:hypothetical protein